MDDILQQVERARRRLNLELFVRVLPWSLFIALLAGCVGLAVPKIWPLAVTATERGWQTWLASWLGGSLAAGLAGAFLYTWWCRRPVFDAAVEVDRRFGLKERVASSLVLTPEERELPTGQALVADAARRVAGVEIAERFRVAVRWTAMLPVVPAAIAVVLALLANAPLPQPQASPESTAIAQETQQNKQAIDELKKKLSQQQQKLESKGLEDAQDLLKKLQEGLDQMQSQEKLDRKEALVKMNELSQELDKRRGELSSSEQMKKQLEQLTKLESGPGEKFSKALNQGNLKRAAEELKQLQNQLAKNELSAEQREQLAKQTNDMAQKLQETVKAHQQAMEDLERQIQQKQDAGDQAGAAKLQEKLDRLKQQERQMNNLQQMADKLSQAAQQMKAGDQQAAAQQLQELAEQLQQAQGKLDQLKSLDELREQLRDAKSAMKCPECNGQGCEHCQNGSESAMAEAEDGQEGAEGQDGESEKAGKSGSLGSGNSQRNSQGLPGSGLGNGRGQGSRPEEKTGSGFFDSKVRGKMKGGEQVRAGFADGPNLGGASTATVQEQIQQSLKSDPDPITDQRLNRNQREHARQFFESSSGQPAQSKSSGTKP